jgi:hypothetical protein
MRRSSICRPLVAVALLLALPALSSGWGFDVHRFVTGRAIALLPPEIRPFFEKHAAFIAEHSVDPDLWRTAGFEIEPPRHFLDLDAYGAYPFDALPRDYAAAVAKFGEETLAKNGTVPWRLQDVYDRLVKAFEQHKAGSSPYALENIKFFVAILAHYAADAHVPLHAVVNYDGQLTGQHGVHSRFESELFARYARELRVDPPQLEPVSQPLEHVFDTLLESYQRVAPLLEADRQAIGDGTEYDDAYFARFYAAMRPTLEERLSKSAASAAALVAGAWNKAGRPTLPLEQQRMVRKRRPA